MITASLAGVSVFVLRSKVNRESGFNQRGDLGGVEDEHPAGGGEPWMQRDPIRPSSNRASSCSVSATVVVLVAGLYRRT